jgi:D-threo-aldose 1-dehydrogenase
MQKVSAERDVPLAAAALHFAFRHPAVSAVLVGMRSPEEVRTDLEMLAVEVPDALWAELDAC